MRLNRAALGAVAALGFLVWHGAALLVAPYPESELQFVVRPLFGSYLRVAYLDHRWTFFAPRPDAGRLIRYEVVRAESPAEEYPLSETLGRADPAYFRWFRLYDRVATGWPEFRESAAAYLCAQHAPLDPRGIRFVILHQVTLTPAQYRAGMRPTDPEALRRETLPEIPCAAAHGDTSA